jgi:hypothetical protein
MSVGDMTRAFSGAAVASGFASDGNGGQQAVTPESNIYAQAAANAATPAGGTLNRGAFS